MRLAALARQTQPTRRAGAELLALAVPLAVMLPWLAVNSAASAGVIAALAVARLALR